MSWFLSRRGPTYLKQLYSGHPEAKADIRGSALYSSIIGSTSFYQAKEGVLVVTEVMGLPSKNEACAGGVFGYHIHEGTSCAGTGTTPFPETGGHFNPNGCRHPAHSGDLPPLFEANGRAFAVCLTNRFTIGDLIGRTVIIHSAPDDFTSQPSGNSGEKIACGVIK